MRALTLTSALPLSAALFACSTGGSTSALTVQTTEPTPGSASVGAGQSTTLTATAGNAQGQVLPNTTFTWKSSSEAVAKVAGGVVTGMGARAWRTSPPAQAA
ncbi:hypothetical protein [Deinococcus hopiensis]|uniref:BIG2 domain-containing protein n=1 Tax=Deinococcus hopiensis KR-140 TaxID=695939 RepID=A0A1W1VWC2_9DEIO|nr:hypothetical protein [Deinococcus hopiensis]SMB97550.1 hypothetical protein SAMN00790413_06046 [Deinococcus hopiensis KR-140]